MIHVETDALQIPLVVSFKNRQNPCLPFGTVVDFCHVPDWLYRDKSPIVGVLSDKIVSFGV